MGAVGAVGVADRSTHHNHNTSSDNQNRKQTNGISEQPVSDMCVCVCGGGGGVGGIHWGVKGDPAVGRGFSSVCGKTPQSVGVPHVSVMTINC